MDPAVWNALWLECGFALLLPIDVGILALWFSKRKADKPKWPATWEAVFVLLHLVFGSLVLWQYSDSAYNIITPFDIITLVFWGPILVAFAVREARKKKQATDGTDEETTDSPKEGLEPEAADIEEPVSHQRENESSQDEPSAGRRERRGRRRRD